MPTKRLIDARRMRKGLPRGFGWIDHRLLREGYITNCTPQALALYVLLVCASDAQGLSYYSGPRIAELLRLEPEVVAGARRLVASLNQQLAGNDLLHLYCVRVNKAYKP
jgi:hypothetical protein